MKMYGKISCFTDDTVMFHKGSDRSEVIRKVNKNLMSIALRAKYRQTDAGDNVTPINSSYENARFSTHQNAK